VNVSGQLTDSLTLDVEEEFRFADVTGPELARQHTDLGLGWNVGDYFTAVGGYRNTSLGEHRLYLGVDVDLFEAGGLDFDNSTRVELRDWDSFRGRTKLVITASLAGVAPYATEEVFVDETGLTGNRASVGVSKAITDTFSVRGYYLLDTILGDTSSHTHVVGTGVSVSL
jgi:hypothetical protein